MEARLFEPGTTPECTTRAWYADREAAPHLEQPGHRERLLLAAAYVHDFGPRSGEDGGLRSLVDLGCGDGGLLSVLRERYPVLDCWGYDLCPANVEAARRRGVQAELLDVVNGDPRWAEVAVATEMLEHLVDPHGFLRRVREHCCFLVASSPWDENESQHYEFHTWAWDPAGYRAMIDGAGWEVMYHEPVNRFQVVAARCA